MSIIFFITSYPARNEEIFLMPYKVKLRECGERVGVNYGSIPFKSYPYTKIKKHDSAILPTIDKFYSIYFLSRLFSNNRSGIDILFYSLTYCEHIDYQDISMNSIFSLKMDFE